MYAVKLVVQVVLVFDFQMYIIVMISMIIVRQNSAVPIIVAIILLKSCC